VLAPFAPNGWAIGSLPLKQISEAEQAQPAR